VTEIGPLAGSQLVLRNRENRWCPSLWTVPAIARLAIELLDEEQLGDAIKLLEPRMALLARASQRKCW